MDTSILLAELMDTEYVASVVVTGLAVVFSALIILVVLLSISGKLFTMKKKAKKQEVVEKKVVNSQPIKSEVKVPDVEDGISEEVVAVISAAIAAMGASSGKKLALKSVKTSKPHRLAWSQAGLYDNTKPF